MTPESKIYAVDKNGNPCMRRILEPLFATIFPALSEEAEEITITRCISGGDPQVSAGYRKKGKIWGSVLSEDINSAVVFLRIRIIAGMSLESHEKQSGVINVQYGTERLPVNVELVSVDEREVLVLRPEWAAARK